MEGVGRPNLLRGDLGSSRHQEVTNFGTVVHHNDTMAKTAASAMPCEYTPQQRLSRRLECGFAGPMTTTFRSLRRLVAMLAAGSVIAVLCGCAVGSQAVGDDTAMSSTQSSRMVATPPPVSTDSVRIELRFGNELATATLGRTSAAREFAAMLPLQLDLGDRMGQAKSGRLPRAVDLSGVQPVFDPAVGQLYYWAPNDTFAIFYDDFGQFLPDPGLARLGVVDTGMDRIAGAGSHFTVRIDLLTPTPRSDRSTDPDP
jgi:hypothetical protein